MKIFLTIVLFVPIFLGLRKFFDWLFARIFKK